jgi:FkbM family methyltransferase
MAALFLSRIETCLGAAAPALLLDFRRMIGYGVEPELRLLPMLCNRDLLSIDIGANAGMYTYHMLKHSKGVYAFEPNPRFISRLLRCFPRGVVVHGVALSDAAGESELRIPLGINGAGTLEKSNDFGGSYAGSDVETVKVPMKTLDEFNLDGVGFIKIDVEGYEHSVLCGSAETITRNKPAMLIEIEERHRKGAVSQVQRYLATYGYRGFFYEHGCLHPIARFDPAEHQVVDNLGVRYINNFVFVTPDRLPRLKEILNER